MEGGDFVLCSYVMLATGDVRLPHFTVFWRCSDRLSRSTHTTFDDFLAHLLLRLFSKLKQPIANQSVPSFGVGRYAYAHSCWRVTWSAKSRRCDEWAIWRRFACVASTSQHATRFFLSSEDFSRLNEIRENECLVLAARLALTSQVMFFWHLRYRPH